MPAKKSQPVTLKYVLLGAIPDEVIEHGREKLRVKQYVHVPSKKNGKLPGLTKAGKPYYRPSPFYIKWKIEHDKLFSSWFAKLFEDGSVKLPIVRCDVNVKFYYPTRAIHDPQGGFETIADMMKEHGIIADDSYHVFNNISMRGVTRRNKPRTEIYLTIIPPDHPQYDWDETPADYKKQVNKRAAFRKKVSRSKTSSIKLTDTLH